MVAELERTLELRLPGRRSTYRIPIAGPGRSYAFLPDSYLVDPTCHNPNTSLPETPLVSGPVIRLPQRAE